MAKDRTIAPGKLRRRARESLITTIFALLFTKIPLVFVLVPLLELAAAIRASRANTQLVRQGEKESLAGVIAVPLGGLLFVVTGIMAAATIVESYEAISRAREAREQRQEEIYTPSPERPARLELKPAEMVPTNNRPAAAAAAVLPISRKVVLEVTAKTWEQPVKDITKPLGDLLANNGVGVSTDAATADAIVAVSYEETKGVEFRSAFGTGASVGFGTDFKVAVSVLDPKDRKSRAKFEITRRSPATTASRDFRGVGFDALSGSAELSLLATAIAAAAGDASAPARMLPALVHPSNMYEASAMLEALHYKPSTPRETAYVTIGKQHYDAALRLGEPGIELLVTLLDAMAWSYSERLVELSRVVAKSHAPAAAPAVERALGRMASHAQRDFTFDEERIASLIEALKTAAEARVLPALGRNCITADRSDTMKERLGPLLPGLYKNARIRPPVAGKRAVTLVVAARGWQPTRFDVERVLRAQLAAANIEIVADPASSDGYVDVDYAEVEGEHSETAKLSATEIEWSVVVVDPARRRARMLSGERGYYRVNESGNEDPQARAIDDLKERPNFKRVGAFVADTLAGESREADSCEKPGQPK